MSAFLVEKEHITELVKAYFSYGGTPYFYNLDTRKEIELNRKWFGEFTNNKTPVALMLAQGNWDSLNARYKNYAPREEETDYLAGISQIMRSTRRNSSLTFPELINMCNCLDYQSCETFDYYKSDSFFILERIKNHLVRKWCDREIDEETQVSWAYYPIHHSNKLKVVSHESI